MGDNNETVKEKEPIIVIKLGEFEQFAVGLVISLLGFLAAKLTNATEIAALNNAIQFLQSLIAGQIGGA
jgi:hypothetical protein